MLRIFGNARNADFPEQGFPTSTSRAASRLERGLISLPIFMLHLISHELLSLCYVQKLAKAHPNVDI